MDYSLFVVVEHLKEPLPADTNLNQNSRNRQFDQQSGFNSFGNNRHGTTSKTFKQRDTSIFSIKSARRALRKQRFNEFGRNVFVSEDRTMIYHIGLIDYLQEWNNTKKIEQFLKTKFRGANKEKLSAVEPVFYRQRFLKNMQIILNYNQEKNKKKTMWDEFR